MMASDNKQHNTIAESTDEEKTHEDPSAHTSEHVFLYEKSLIQIWF